MSESLPARAIVLLHETEVGILERSGESSRFEPSEKWAEQPAGTRPVLGQQFEEDPFAAHGNRYGAPGWFEHLLPEVGGPLRGAIASSLELAPGRSFALLLALGEDLPGAVRVRAVQDGLLPTVARRERAEAEPTTSENLPLRISLAGLQFKISARLGQRGIALPAQGEEGDWILKFADQRFATLPRNEFLTMFWAAKAGLDVPDIRLVATDSVPGLEAIGPAVGDEAFAIRRYDRSGTGRIHQEDFAQVLGIAPGDSKYTATNADTILKVVSTIAPADANELIRRLVFSVMCGNDDGHAKNWSLCYPDRVHPRLSPAYDLVSTVEYFPNNTMSLKLAGARRFDQVDRERFRSLATRVGLDSRHIDEVVGQAASDCRSAWQEVRELDEMYPELRDLTDDRLGSIRL